MGNRQDQLKPSSFPKHSLKKLDFSGPKPESHTLPFSCICTKIDGNSHSNFITLKPSNKLQLISLARGYLIRKSNTQILRSHRNYFSKNDPTNCSEIAKTNCISNVNTLHQGIQIKSKITKNKSSRNYYMYEAYEETTEKSEKTNLGNESSPSETGRSEVTEWAKQSFQNPLKYYCEFKNNKKELGIDNEDYEEDYDDLDISTKKTDCSGIKMLSGSVYYGKLKDGKPHGAGVEKWNNGKIYEGTYYNGKFSGQGILIWPDKSMYKGGFVNNNMQGYGIFKWSNGNCYEGMWKESKMHGEGKFTWSNMNKFVGEYEDGLKHGNGVFFWSDGRQIKGVWQFGKIQVCV